ncbi:GGDEF domain-containing protein [Janthinobacterium sp. SUN118]|uniref:GGDEF domain-containing protein n=1 Tax=Janthinobacterium sp. SUN118 TaxID=3004100 RepID=UPI0025B27E9D|nr:GGDEF domain-containing protein [Janthinobacterium sp. SUN118]MDN2710872.1 GGDEF domain-containing protein [Janthinobacterium sp. SUN118]
MKLDPATIVLMSTLMTGAMCVVMFSAQRSFPHSVQGLREWVTGMLGLILASGLFALRSLIVPELLLPVANSVLLCGVGMLLIGTQRFYGVRPSWRLFHLVWLLGLLVMLCWLYLRPDFAMRVALFSFLMLALHAAQFLVIARHGERHISTVFFGLLALVQTLSMLHRGLSALQEGGAGSDILHGGPHHSLYLAILAFMTLLLPVGFMAVATRRLQMILEQHSNHDPLTAVLNRRGFAQFHARVSARLRRAEQSLAVLSIDLDFFKAINDRHGHAVGDLVLVDVAGVIRSVLRDSDAVARFGGEEFVVLLPDTQLARAELVAQRLQDTLRQPRPDAGLPRYTLSIGIACQAGGGETLDSLLLRSDKALYRAKQLGRDRVEVADKASASLQQQHHICLH